jgi:replicative DNA helicase
MSSSPELAVVEKEPAEPVKYEFEDEFQTKIAALSIRDSGFNSQVEGLITPDYFENTAEAILVAKSLAFF